MKTKLNKIVSALLLSVMIFSSVSVCLPLVASAAASESYVVGASSEKKDAATVVTDKLKNDRTAEESLAYDIAENYVDSYTNGTFTIYVNRYTGILYYKNEITGQILTSNPTDPQLAAKEGESAKKLLSQITVSLFENSNTTNVHTMDSTTKSAMLGQISVSAIKNGLRVNYAIGNTSNRYLLPAMMTPESFHNVFLYPFVDEVYRQWRKESIAGTMKDEYNKVFYQYKHKDNVGAVNDDGYYNHLFVVKYIGSVLQKFPSAEMNERTNMMYQLLQCYSKNDDGNYVLDTNLTNELKNENAKRVHTLCPEYDYDAMYADEKEAGYVQAVENIPVVRCAIEYTLNADGSLNASLPANAIIYDETFYTLDYINVLQYFGAGKMIEKVSDDKGNIVANTPVDGYLFYPDGSGMILDFADFGGQSFKLENNIYGMDSAFSFLDTSTINTRGESITMPVYGIVNTTKIAGESVDGGFFAIMEEGAAMSTIAYAADAASHNYLYVYPTYKPYPADEYNLANTISVGGLGKYIIVSDSKYTGSYTTRYVMLSDPSLAEKAGDTYHEASYVGMANYYRDYLKGNGTLAAIENPMSTLPLYIESFGAMDVMDRFLTFPVTKSISLTTFEDVASMYAELKAEGVKNINFRLSGFANGGMSATYPVKSRWAKACGGAGDFKDLLETAAKETVNDQNFGLFPEFDFMYLSNSAAFDGMSVKGNVSCMVDNRYASKQVYSSITGEFDTIYAMIVSADALDRLYTKFLKKYDNYRDATGLSVSTLGSDLNSNFDKKNPVSRDDAQGYVSEVLDRMAQDYSVMTSQGNIYAVKYADHILNVSTDSSYYRYSSYTVPFVGMILHGYVNYAGAPLNYSGSPDYDILRSIENGASIYYIIGYQNTDIMKDDEEFNKYYSISYEHWFDDIVEKYAIINSQIGNLQDYHIVGHEILIGERVIDRSEQIDNLKALMDEFVQNFRATLESEIDIALGNLYNPENPALNKDKRIGVEADLNNLVAVALDMFGRTEDELNGDQDFKKHFDSFKVSLAATLAEFNKEYDVTGVAPENIVTVRVDSFDYESKYQYVTDSTARDDNYDHTDYTVDNDLIVMVTYQKGEEKVSFILNYNIYSVEVTLEDGRTIPIDKYGYQKI